MLFKLANAAAVNVRFSDTLANPSTLISIALTLKGIDLSRIVFVQSPTGSNPAHPHRVAPLPGPPVLTAALKSDHPVSLPGTVHDRASLHDYRPAGIPKHLHKGFQQQQVTGSKRCRALPCLADRIPLPHRPFQRSTTRPTGSPPTADRDCP